MLISRLVPMLIGISFSSQMAFAAPFRPLVNTEVLEVLPFKANDAVASEITQTRVSLRANPNDSRIAVRLARLYYDQVAEEGDPRYLGYAQAALSPWWAMATPPEEVQVMRASMRQFLHDFSGAIRDLDNVLDANPDNAQARALRATIHIVQARYNEAKKDCSALHSVSSQVISTACIAMVDGLTGHARQAKENITAALRNEPQATKEERLWALIRLAELSQRLEHPADAEKLFKEALSLGISDTFLLAAYADLLLDQKRYVEVVDLLGSKIRSDTLLLRLVFAEQALHTGTAQARRATLAARFEAAQMRGDTVHQQEEARFALYVENDPRKALRLAQENWKVQKEPRDARIYLEAAVALKDRVAAKPVLEWLEQSHIEDRYLISLGKKLSEAVQ